MAPARQSGGNRVPEVPRPAPVDDSEDVFDDVTFSRNLKDLYADRLDPGPTELAPGGNLVSTGETEPSPKPTKKPTVMRIGRGEVRPSGKHLGASAGLTAEQAQKILSASSQLGSDYRELSDRYAVFLRRQEADLPVDQSAMDRTLEQIKEADRLSTIGTKIRAALLDGRRAEMERLLNEADVPYRDWL